MIKVAGIDPGLAATGVGLVQGYGLNIANFSYGSIRTSKAQGIPERLDHIYTQILSVLRDETPDLMVLEDVFSLEKYPKSGILLGKVSGVILLAARHSDTAVKEISVREAKQVLSGSGNADKAQLEKAVRHRLNAVSRIRPYHASDALALAMVGLFRYPSV
ncbi:MAG: crossover junction endodeoxyribonuclease RuvC [Desulfococcaceae bacterium]|jgi:crossover junction endodeoxyribonuclease RuvC|nr:crossover junction endodeoxyribonuclease RuvC [Desulfococcaceae bacterium]